MPFRERIRNDEGSIVLAFLALFIISGLVVAVTATVVAGEKQDRFDRSFEKALLLAETGHSRIVSLIQSNPSITPEALATASTPTFVPDANGGSAGTTTVPLRATEADGNYTVQATKTVIQQRPITIIRWKITASGTSPDGKTRRIESEVVVRPLFGLAAFGKQLMRMNGANGADSFYSTEGTGVAPQTTDICLKGAGATYAYLGTPTAGVDASQTKVNMCDPSNRGGGTVATNGKLDLQGQVPTDVDLMEVHNARENVVDPLPTAAGYCSGPGTACADQVALNRLFYYREPVDLQPVKACETTGTPSTYGPGSVFGSSTYFVNDIELDGTMQFQGTSALPTTLCVSGNFSIKGANLINFQNAGTSAAPRWVPRRPGTLQVILTGSSNSSAEFKTHSAASLVFYAPNNSVTCGSAGNIFGSIVANNIDCQGDFRFHYDMALGDSLTYPAIRAENWREF